MSTNHSTGPHKRCLAWSYTNTRDNPKAIDHLNFHGAIVSVSNWEAWSPPELANRLAFRPMLHSKDRLTDPNWINVEKEAKDQIIHFFNEPERANTSPEEAATLWRQHMVPLRKRQNRLVSPSCASDPAGSAWIHKWMSLVKDSPPDFLGLHWYGTHSTDMISFLEDMHKTYPKCKIVVSEWASISRNEAEVVQFTVDMANWMDRTDWIFEYSLFGCLTKVPDTFTSPEALLMKPDASFTPLMLKYMNEQPMRR